MFNVMSKTAATRLAKRLARRLFAIGAFFAAAVIAGCGGGGGVSYDPIVVEQGSIDSVDGYATAVGFGEEAVEQTLDDSDLLDQRAIYFEFDSSVLTEGGEAVAAAHARFVLETDSAVILEGHSDERGTREYNLALAESRAKSVAGVMQAFGVPAGRIRTVSYGEERPAALGHDESAWRLNRRVEIIYP